MATTTIFGVTCTINAGTVITSALSGPRDCVIDAHGNLWLANYTSGTIQVLSATGGTFFGVTATANTLTTIITAPPAGPWGLAFDSAGNLYVTDFGHSTLKVLPISSGTLFGVSVTANTLTTLVSGTPYNGPSSLVFDTAGNLYCANSGASNIIVLPTTTATIFGTAVTANTAKALTAPTGLGTPRGIAFDTAGNLYYSDFGNEAIYVLPLASGTIFGQAVGVNTQKELFSALTAAPRGLHFDTAAGNLYFAAYTGNDASVVAASSGTILGVPVAANTPTNLLTTGLSGPSDVTVDAAGDLFVTDFTSSNLVVMAAGAPPPPTTGGFFAFC